MKPSCDKIVESHTIGVRKTASRLLTVFVLGGLIHTNSVGHEKSFVAIVGSVLCASSSTLELMIVDMVEIACSCSDVKVATPLSGRKPTYWKNWLR